MDTIEAIVNEVETFNQSIVDALNSKNISNTGEAARSLHVEYGFDYVRSLGIFYLEFLDTGRGPGSPPPFGKILQWAMQKTGQPKNECWGLAVYVTNKIAELGTEIFRNNNQGIELEKKVITLRENVNNVVRQNTNLIIEQRLDRFKEAFLKKNFQL